MNSDFKDLLQILGDCEVEYLIAGGYAVIHHSQPRYTKDIDIWLKPSVANSSRLMKAFIQFGVPMIGVTQQDFTEPQVQYTIGVSPCMIDFLTSIPGLEFDPCWESKTTCTSNGFSVYYLNKQDLIKSKQVAGRLQDLADIEELNRANPC